VAAARQIADSRGRRIRHRLCRQRFCLQVHRGRDPIERAKGEPTPSDDGIGSAPIADGPGVTMTCGAVLPL
jgi:hypothetical protein